MKGLQYLQVKVFWVVTQCGVVIGYHRFRGPCCPHLQGEVPGVGKSGTDIRPDWKGAASQ
jgi:hypothetical protein